MIRLDYQLENRFVFPGSNISLKYFLLVYISFNYFLSQY